MSFSSRHFDPDAKGPLNGIKVLDLSRLVAGNMLSLQLGDFGADVIKVEPPEGDPLRVWKDEGHSFFWKVYGRNKRSLVLNLRQPAAMAALNRLIDQADVFIENFRPGTLEQMGLAPRGTARAQPRPHHRSHLRFRADRALRQVPRLRHHRRGDERLCLPHGLSRP